MIEWFSWIAIILTIIGIYFNAKKSVYCWPIWLISSLMWVIYYIINFDLPSIITWIIFTIANVYGLYNWIKK